MKRAVFLDRDNTLNFDPGYLNDPDQLRLLPGVGTALACLQEAGFVLVVVTNQSGVGRGLIEPKQLESIHERLNEHLASFGARIHRFECCLHHPQQRCDCRKPAPTLLLRAASALGLQMSESFMVGDRLSDVEAGRLAGCRGSYLITPPLPPLSASDACPVGCERVADLAEASRLIMGRLATLQKA